MPRRDLLVVDGYNVLRATPRYRDRIDDDGAGDPFVRAREALVSDVAAFAQGSYDAVVVFDGAGNLSPERPVFSRAGVRVVFSATGESADSVIERLAREARSEGRATCVVTSDNTVRATVGGVPVTSLSSSLLARELDVVSEDVRRAAEERSHAHMTLADRLPPDQRAKLDALMGRRV